MYIDKLLNLIGYDSDYILNNLDLSSLKLDKEEGELFVVLTAQKPLEYHEFNNLIEAFNNQSIPNINKINYDFVYESYEESDVKDYYKVIMNTLSSESLDFLNAVDFSVRFNKELNELNINVPSSFAQIIISKKKIVKLFNQYGFKNINIEFEMVDLDERIETEIEEAKKRHLDGVDLMLSRQKQAQEGVFLNDKKGRLFGTQMDIQYLPTNEEEYNQFKNSGKFENSIIIKGFVELNDEDTIEKKSKAKLAISDETGYCYIERNLRAVEEKRFFKDIQLNQYVEVSGYMYLQKNGDVSFTITNIFVSNYIKPITDRVDDEPVKRVELHLHTKMSQLDGIAYMEDYCKTAQIFGHKAIACTDHGSVQSFHDLYEYTKKHPDLKPLYGAEFCFVDEDRVKCAYDPKHIKLDDATFVVYDLETTGFSVNYEKIIEIGAVKIKNGVIVDRFSEFVNPGKLISQKVMDLTKITNEDVKDARTIDAVLKDFYKFFDGAILVAHNAHFDIGHLYQNLNNLGYKYERFPVIDTLYLAKALYPDHKRYNLESLGKMLGVEQTVFHRALDDATATGEVFLHMLQELKKLGIEYHDEINSVIKKEEFFRYPVRPGHINVLCKTQEGLRNLYYITSMANTDFFVRDPIIPKKFLEEYREGLLIGSGCRNSVFFDTALRESEEQLEKIIDFYDYIEVQPPSRFEYQKESMDDWHYCITDTIKKIIRVAKKHGIPVVATGDCHQINKEDTKYRQILVNYSTKSSAYRHDLKADPKASNYEDFLAGKNIIPDEYYMTTREMLDEFSFLGEKIAYEIVVVNSNLIADSCEFVQSFTDKPFPPKDDFMKKKGIPSAEEYVKSSVYNRAHEMYGELLPGIVKDRIDRELSSIIDNKFSTIYLISQALVKKSEEDGYVVGSRGSVGSSFVAHLMDITEVNSLPPHYRCPKCFFSAFKYTEEEKKIYGIRKDEEPFQKDLNEVLSGYDLPDKNCPCCGTLMIRDGHDIPFETFLGVKEKPKTPDIDLNFSGDNQGQIHNYIRELFGETKAFRAGTILTCKSNVSFAIVRDYYDQINLERQKRGMSTIKISKAKIDALAQHIIEVKKSSSQHPGGIVVVPEDHEVYEVTPVQYPGDSTDRNWKTTHFDYHTFEKNFFKLDVLGHDDPTVIRYLMKFVKEHPEEFPFTNAKDIPVNDHKVYQMMNDTKVLNILPQDINSPVATYGISEFGTSFVRGLLEVVRPSTFAELVKVSGLSHGTDVWNNNAEELFLGKGIEKHPLPLKTIIGCRDDIMLDLINFGVPSKTAFSAMESIRKGVGPKKPKDWQKLLEDLSQYDIPKWYINSCAKISYLFPKAHATAYIIMALRIAWFKLYKPIYFYSAIMSKKMVSFDIEAMVGGAETVKERLQELRNMPISERKVKDEDLMTTLELALEMIARGMKFYNVDLNKSKAKDFAVAEDGSGLYLPFIAIDGLGENSALSIVKARNEKPFDTQKDFKDRCQVNATNFEKMKELGMFNGMAEDNQLTLDLGI